MIIINEKDRDDTIIENLNVTRNGIYQEANKAYSPVIVEVPEMVLNELSVTENGEYTPSQGTDGFSKVNVNVALPENGYLLKTVKDDVVSFDDGSILPMPSVIAEIKAVQDLHGYDSPWVGGAGKNKFNKDTVTLGKYLTNTGAEYSSAGGSYSDYIPIKLNTPYYFSHIVGASSFYSMCVYDENKTLLESKNISGGKDSSDSVTFTQGAYIRVNVNQSNLDICQIELGSTATSYAPYSNICPISGFSEGNVHVSPTTDAQDGTTYSVSWESQAGTVYGGNVDLVSGVLTVTHANIASYDGETLPSTWISDRDVYSVGGTPTTGAQVVYELATPLTYQLTPIQVNSLLGINKVWNDTNGETEVKYFGK